LLTKEEGYRYLRLKKAKIRSVHALTMLPISEHLETENHSIFYVFLLENGIKEINKNEANNLVKQKRAVYVNEMAIKMLIKRKDLIKIILEKHQHQCVFCKVKTDCTVFLEPEKDESVTTPENAVCACPRCRTEYTKKDYLEWLNIEESLDGNEQISLLNHTKTKTYHISKETATRLVQEKMATFLTDSSLYVLFDRSSFRFYLKKRDKNSCYYCHKKGSTIDHVFPKSKGGLTTPSNCVWSCTTCNEKKANLSKEEFIN
jgi:5-methylcytosine-specific restriction endonuclease McrA